MPNRFDLDKNIFKENPKVDGVYNAIGTFFYSEESRKIFFEGGNDEFITVKENVSPENLFKELTGIGNSIGYIHVNGLTIRRTALEKLNHWFSHELKVHQDTEFIIRLSYFCELLPGELYNPVALRGIHSENRITANNINCQKRTINQKKLAETLFVWAEENKLAENYRKHFQLMLNSRAIPTIYYLKRWRLFFLTSFKHTEFFFKARYYDYFHNSLFGKGVLSKFLLQLKYKLQKIFGISWKIET
jgi:hypothetical protein